MIFSWFAILISLLIVGAGLPFYSSVASAITATVGYAIFWWGLLTLTSILKRRFWISFLWFSFVQSVHLFWLTSSTYMGPAIFVFYFGVIVFFGLQFACISFLFSNTSFRLLFQKVRFPDISWMHALLIASFWTLFESSRYFLFTTCSWNPVGLCLSMDSTCAFAGIFGTYGLSFWVVFVNAFFFYAAAHKKMTLWISFALLPWAFSFVQSRSFSSSSVDGLMTTTIIQTAILPEEKDWGFAKNGSFIHPLNQWERICDELEQCEQTDLIVLPETALSFGAYRPIYYLSQVEALWNQYFGSKCFEDFPSLQAPFASQVVHSGKKYWQVSSAFICQALSNHFQSKLIIGLERTENGKCFNSALFFEPRKNQAEVYDKQILVPLTETVDLQWIGFLLKPIAKMFGCVQFLEFGDQTNVLGVNPKFGVNLCIEEIYPELIRSFKKDGAELLVNLTNDVWFPQSSLPYHHALHGKLRAAECGLFNIRASNTGVTCIIDCFGRILYSLPPSETMISSLHERFSYFSCPTLFSKVGSWPLFVFCLIIFFRFLLERFRKTLFVVFDYVSIF